MREQLQTLLVLQDRDQKVRAMRAQQKSLPTEKKSLEAKLAAAQQALDLANQQSKQNEVDRRKLELEVEAKRGAINRFKTQQQQTRKNEEYQALTHEIAHAEADIHALEDRELDLMERSEEIQKSTAEAAQNFAKTQTIIRDQIARAEAGAAVASARLAELEADHARLGAGVPEDVLDLYRRLLVKKGDAAVVPLEHEVCGGCHMKVPVQIASQVRGEGQLTQCPNCGRILYRVL